MLLPGKAKDMAETLLKYVGARMRCEFIEEKLAKTLKDHVIGCAVGCYRGIRQMHEKHNKKGAWWFPAALALVTIKYT